MDTWLNEINTALALLALLGSFYVAIISKRQLSVAKKTADSQILVTLLEYLYSSELRQARQIVRMELSKKPFSDWTELDREAAGKVCSSYDYAGMLGFSGMIPIDIFLISWGASICHCYSALKPFLEEGQAPGQTGVQYWSSFSWLNKQAQSYKTQ